MPNEWPKQSVIAVSTIKTITLDKEIKKGARVSEINRFDKNQIDLIGFQTTLPCHALSGSLEKTLSVFFILSLEIVNARIFGFGELTTVLRIFSKQVAV